MNTAGVLFSLYIFLESLSPIAAMKGGLYRFCHKIKYISALGISVYMLHKSYTARLGIADIFCLITVALFVWPRTVYRLHRWAEDFIEFHHDL